MTGPLRAQLRRLRELLAGGDKVTRVVTERAADDSLKAYAIADDGTLVELEPVRRLSDHSLSFAWPGEASAAAALSDDELLADAQPTTTLSHLGWPGWRGLHGGMFVRDGLPTNLTESSQQ
jgi:hypothetical protein